MEAFSILLKLVKIKLITEDTVMVSWCENMDKVMEDEIRGNKRIFFWLRVALQRLGWKGGKINLTIKQNCDGCFYLFEADGICSSYIHIDDDENIYYRCFGILENASNYPEKPQHLSHNAFCYWKKWEF